MESKALQIEFENKIIEKTKSFCINSISTISKLKIKYEKDKEKRVGDLADLQDEYHKMEQSVENQKHYFTNEEEVIYNSTLIEL